MSDSPINPDFGSQGPQFVPHGGVPPQFTAVPNPHLALSIASVAFSAMACPVLFALSVPALVFSIQVENLWYQGRTEEAIEKAKRAKLLSLIALIAIGLLVVVVGVALTYR